MLYKKDFEKQKKNILKILNEDSKILNFTHVDMDGIGSNIALTRRLKNVVKIEVNYHDVAKRMANFDLKSYDVVIFSDICPIDCLETLKQYNHIIILDHHNTAVEFHNPEKNIFVYDGISGSKLCQEFIIAMFGLSRPSSEVTELIDIINDYDLWIHADRRSTFFNWLYDKYGSDGFKNRFEYGDVKLLNSEKEWLIKRTDLLRDTFAKLDLFDFETVNATMIVAGDFINDLTQKVFDKHSYGFVLILNPSNLQCSIRARDTFDVGTMLKELGIGGGHKNAGGFRSTDQAHFEKNIKSIEKYAFDNCKSIRK